MTQLHPDTAEAPGNTWQQTRDTDRVNSSGTSRDEPLIQLTIAIATGRRVAPGDFMKFQVVASKTDFSARPRAPFDHLTEASSTPRQQRNQMDISGIH